MFLRLSRTKGLSSIEPNDAGDELDGGEEVPSGLLVSGGDRTKLLDLGEEVLDQMARRIERSVVVARRGPVGPWRDHRGLTSGRQRLKYARVGVERLVGDQHISLHGGQQAVSPNQGVDLGAQSAARASDCLILASFFWAPALCWWARTMVLSIIAYSLSASAARY